MRQFESSQLDALITVMQAAQEVHRQDLLEFTPTILPTLQQVMKGHEEAVYRLSFNPDGQSLATTSAEATSSDDGVIRLWRIESFEELIARGCHWLEDYFATHPHERLDICPPE